MGIGASAGIRSDIQSTSDMSSGCTDYAVSAIQQIQRQIAISCQVNDTDSNQHVNVKNTANITIHIDTTEWSNTKNNLINNQAKIQMEMARNPNVNPKVANMILSSFSTDLQTLADNKPTLTIIGSKIMSSATNDMKISTQLAQQQKSQITRDFKQQVAATAENQLKKKPASDHKPVKTLSNSSNKKWKVCHSKSTTPSQGHTKPRNHLRSRLEYSNHLIRFRYYQRHHIDSNTVANIQAARTQNAQDVGNQITRPTPKYLQ